MPAIACHGRMTNAAADPKPGFAAMAFSLHPQPWLALWRLALLKRNETRFPRTGHPSAESHRKGIAMGLALPEFCRLDGLPSGDGRFPRPLKIRFLCSGGDDVLMDGGRRKVVCPLRLPLAPAHPTSRHQNLGRLQPSHPGCTRSSFTIYFPLADRI